MRILALPIAACLLVLSAVWVGEGRAFAQAQSLEDNIRVIQQRPFLRRQRVELAPHFGLALNDAMFLHMGAGGSLNYHILEFLSVGGSYTKYFSSETDLFRSVQEDFRVFPEKWALDFFAGGHVQYVPIYGKMALAKSAVLHYDVYIVAGVGVTRTNLSSAAVTGNVGVGTRIFLTRWLTLNFELRDYIFKESFLTGSEIVNNFVLQAGLSLFIPFGFDYEYPK